MKKLTEIGLKYQTDKSYIHGFTELYDGYFNRYSNPRILEIGIYNGASLLMYNEYFNYECKIIGIDNGSQLNFQSDHPNIILKYGDQQYPNTIYDSIEEDCDIIIDDGSHFVEHQINCFNMLISKVKKGGIYIIEDLHTSLHSHFNPNNVQTCIEFLQDLPHGENTPYKNISIFSDVPLKDATYLNHITSVIELW